jgi:tripartite-type tricarboxylate transporter receptor subunit TctC
LNDIAGIDLAHIPYKGSAPVVTALVGGEVSSAFSDYATMKPHIESGKLRLLAVSRPYEPTPNLPTFASLGYPGLEAYSWIGMFVPAKTPMTIVRQLADDVIRISKLPEVLARLAPLGLDPGGMAQEQFASMVVADKERWATMMKKAGIKPE